MSDNEDRPTLAERYSRAVGSSDLRMKRGVGDLDILIAAGRAGGLGAQLLRLRQEFDTVRGTVRHGPLQPVDRLMVLQRLRSLPDTREALGRFAVQRATKVGLMKSDAIVMKLVGKVLDVFLDPQCHHCEGRGFNGGAHRGDKRTICQPCGGTGHRAHCIGRDALDHAFTARLLCDMDAMMNAAEASMRRELRSAG